MSPKLAKQLETMKLAAEKAQLSYKKEAARAERWSCNGGACARPVPSLAEN